MPWRESLPVEERERFIQDRIRGHVTMTELCERYGVSPKTGYLWWSRFLAGEGLGERSRRPLTSPNRMSDRVASLLIDARKSHPFWGARKLLVWLERRHEEAAWPSPSAAHRLLQQSGLVKARRRQPRREHPGTGPAYAEAPNRIWTADYKGHFRTRDRVYVYPLTVADLHSRFLLICQGLPNVSMSEARPHFERVFYEHGLPDAIRTDNGSPFASRGLHGLTRLSVWWMRLGIQHQRIRPASPQENGAHERMHRTLKRACCAPARGNLAAQQRAFNAFREEYNHERPHEALNNDTPASRYKSSPRQYTWVLPKLEYPGHYLVNRVHRNGMVYFQKRLLFISQALAGEDVGLEEAGDGIWELYLGKVLLGTMDERDRIIHP